MDHKERAAQGQNGGTKNEEKDGGTPFAGRVGIKYKSPASPDKSRVCGAFSVSVALLWH